MQYYATIVADRRKNIAYILDLIIGKTIEKKKQL